MPSDRIFRLLTRCLPATSRDEFEREMLEVFRDEHAAASRRGHLRVAALWWRTVKDLTHVASRQHLADLVRDVRHAARDLRRAPAFAAGAVLTIALGVAPATAIFGVIDAVILKPLPYEAPDRLVTIWGTNPQRSASELPLSLPNVADLIASQQVLDELGAYAGSSFTLVGGREPERVRGAVVTVGVLRAVGASPLLGRIFVDGEDLPGAVPVAVVSHALWQSRFGGRPTLSAARSVSTAGRSPSSASCRKDSSFPRERQSGCRSSSIRRRRRAAAISRRSSPACALASRSGPRRPR